MPQKAAAARPSRVLPDAAAPAQGTPRRAAIHATMATQNLGTMSESVLQDYHTKRHTSGVDLVELDAALAEVKSGESRTNWLMARYDPGNTQKLQVQAVSLSLQQSLSPVQPVHLNLPAHCPFALHPHWAH